MLISGQGRLDRRIKVASGMLEGPKDMDGRAISPVAGGISNPGSTGVKKFKQRSIDSVAVKQMKQSRRFYDAFGVWPSINFMASGRFVPCAYHRPPTSYARYLDVHPGKKV
jgi:hypothetical protein